MRISIIVLAVLLCFVAGCRKKADPVDERPHRVWGQACRGLRCSIILDEKEWSKDRPMIVSVAVENVSASEVNLEVSSSFQLSGKKSYWGPVDILGKSKTPPINPRSTISLQKGACLSAKIDISKLGWDHTFSSVWPVREFSSFIPAGQYTLTLDLEVLNGAYTEHIVSNIIEVAITERSQ